jgi:hypothetical protein
MGDVSGALSRGWSDFSSLVRRTVDEPPAPPAAAPPPPTSTRRPPAQALTPEQRVARFKRLLQQRPLPMERFREVCLTEGVPDDGGETASLRAIAWKLLLGYLPEDRTQWRPVLAAQRESYAAFCEELTVDPDAPASPPNQPVFNRVSE